MEDPCMGSRLSCTCDTRNCRNAFRSASFGDPNRVFRFWAELYELSADRARWRMLSPELVSFTLTHTQEHSCLVAHDHRFQILVDTVIGPDSGLVRGAACFVYWRDGSGTSAVTTSGPPIMIAPSSSHAPHAQRTRARRRALGVNLLCREDADCFVELASHHHGTPLSGNGGILLQGALDMRQSPYLSMPSLVRHDPFWTPCTVRIQYAAVAIQTDTMTTPIDLLNTMISSGASDRELVLSDGANAFLLEAEDEHLVSEWRRRILVVAACARARTDNIAGAIAHVNRELERNREKINTMSKMLEIAAGSPLMSRISKQQVNDWQRELELAQLRHYGLKSYSSALQHHKPPSERELLNCCTPSTRRYLAARSLNCVAAMHLHVAYSSRFPNDPQQISPCEEIEDPVMTSSFRTQCSLDSTDSGPPFFGSYLSTSQGQSSSYSISDNPPITVYLPRGQTFIVEPAYTSSGERVLERVCSQLKIDKDKYFLQGFGQNPGCRVRLHRCGEYEIERNGERLGLTICARADSASGVRAEVTAMRAACGRVRVGDTVVAVDGRPVKAMASAADVQEALKTAARLRMRTPRVLSPRMAHRLSMPATASTAVDSMDSVSVRSSPARSSCRREPWGRLANRLGKAWSSEPRMADDAEAKMTRLLAELVATEQAYVEHLNQLIEQYLVPAELALLEAARRVLKVQKTFENDLCEAAGDVAKQGTSSSSGQIRDAVMRVSTLFINKCSKFKVYSEYSAAHLRLQKQLSENAQLQKKCAALNASGDQCFSLESLMIKPIQRVLRYPLFLQEMKRVCVPRSVEATQTAEALNRAEQLALYINEMQRLFEEYGSSLEQIQSHNKQMLQEKKMNIELSELLMFGHVQWLNNGGEDERRRTTATSDVSVFVFATVILLLCPPTSNNKKVRPHRLIAVQDVEVNNCGDGSTADTQFVFALIDVGGPSERVYHLACCQLQMKRHFIKAIRKAVMHSKTMGARPLSESSQSDGGYGSFGDPQEQQNQQLNGKRK